MSISTLEMDGVFEEADIRNRHNCMLQCRNCKKWTRHNDYRPLESKQIPCENCGAIDYDPTSMTSLRTYDPATHAKRKPKVKK